MLMIRLRRAGSKRDPHYRVIVTDRAAGRDGPFLEILGHYHPREQPAEIVFDFDRVDSWVQQGARMSDTVGSLYRQARRGMSPVEAAAPAPVAVELEVAAEAEASEADPVDAVDAAGAGEAE